MNLVISGGNAPPAWGITNLMFGHQSTVPLLDKLITALAVSKKNSKTGFGNDPPSGTAGIVSEVKHVEVPALIHGVPG